MEFDQQIEPQPNSLPVRQEEPLTCRELPRGCRPDLLLNLVHVTMPYVWKDFPSNPGSLRYLQIIKLARRFFESHPGGELKLDHAQYFELCVAAHFTTVGSFVPTDVDNQIRFRLWHPATPQDLLERMATLVEETRNWDIRPVTTRWIPAPDSKDYLSGHRGEWLTIAAGAYGAMRKKNSKRAKHLYDLIQEEIAFETSVYQGYRKLGDGIHLLKASALIAHNMGDLLRVVDMWNLPEDDALRMMAEKALSKEWEKGALVESGELYKLMLSADNHRHFALRTAKPLRKSPDFLVPIGPFFDDWGSIIAKHPLLIETEIGTIVEALIDGWVKLTHPVGYARALVGIESAIPGGSTTLLKLLPSRVGKILKTGLLRQQCTLTKNRFEIQQSQRALKFIKGVSLPFS